LVMSFITNATPSELLIISIISYVVALGIGIAIVIRGKFINKIKREWAKKVTISIIHETKYKNKPIRYSVEVCGDCIYSPLKMLLMFWKTELNQLVDNQYPYNFITDTYKSIPRDEFLEIFQWYNGIDNKKLPPTI